MPYAKPEALVSTDWLARHLSAPDVHVVDATYFMPGSGRNPRAEYEACHIPGAVFFDIDEVADSDNPLPHMLPPPEKFTARVRKLGLGAGTRIVIYDALGLMSAARVWWMFRVFGHADVAVLDGGLPQWKREGRPVSDMPPVPRHRHFTSHLNHMLVRELDQMIGNVKHRREQVVDARSAGRFEGSADEPWANGRRGHIPGALNLPYTDLLDPETQCFLPVETLKARVAAAGIDLSQPVVASCGSGITACVVTLALYLLGKTDVAVYDGSWAEWGSRNDLAAETGPAAAPVPA